MIRPGIYRHHKGGLYRVLFQAIESTNERAGIPVVVYLSMTKGTIHVRTLEEFNRFVDGTFTPRFEYAGERHDH